MKFVYVSILIIISALWLCAKIQKPELPAAENGYSKIFLVPAAQICKWLDQISSGRAMTMSRVKNRLKDQKLASNLQILYPGDSAESRIFRYKVGLISTILLIVFAGSAMCLVITLLAEREGILTEDDLIYRNTYGGVDVEADLSAGIESGEDTEEFRIDTFFPARLYTHEEADALFEQMSEVIDADILATNDRADHIIRPLHLANQIEGYPFSITWECSDYELVDYDGTVHNTELTSPQVVTLTADCLYEGDHRYLVRDFYICPRELTVQEQIYEEILTSVKKADEDSVTKDHITLPQEISFGKLSWKENIADISPMILLGTLLIAVMIIPFKESEINGMLKKRSRELLIEYPSFVSQLTLFLGAGMSVRNCLIGMGRKASVEKIRKCTCLEKELIITGHELEVGISDAEAIEHFGKRCGTREYMRFSALLTQNMKKGSSDLIGMLREESEDAFVLRKNEARKLGEEASTKMLLPMVMMLTVVMIIIMVPAYMSFSS